MAFLECENSILGTTRTHKLRKPITTIGRAKGNDLVLDDPMVRPSHVTVIKSGGGYDITLSDRAGELYINGRRTRSAPLTPGDHALVGAWKLTLRDGSPAAVEPVGGELPLATLEELVDLSAQMMRDTTPESLFSALLSGLVKLTRAEKGFIIVLRDGTHSLAASHNVQDERLDMTAVSDSIVKQVIEHLKPVIVSDAMRDSRFGRAQSVVDLRLSSVMCVPMIYRDDLLGVIYLGNDKITDLFTETDLALLKIYSAQASLIIHSALLLNQLRLDNRNLRTKLRQAGQGRMIGASPPMKSVFKVLRRVAPTDLSLLILGDTGTGKELVAREAHALSERKAGKFIAINCGAIPENLLESELFGHKKGSFTGAVSDKTGKVEAANGGTLFLDEIGEMPMQLQVKLLRVLQERVIERVGDIEPRPVDIRVIAATNQDLTELVRTGEFREDLYYRLNELTVQLPPLRDRGEDIVVLAQYFLNKYRDQYEAKTRGFTNHALMALKNYYWPGNVRELENRIKKAVIMSDRALLSPEDVGLDSNDKRHIRPLTEAQETFKLDYIRQALELNNWNKAQTARDLGVDARTIFRYVEKLND